MVQILTCVLLVLLAPSFSSMVLAHWRKARIIRNTESGKVRGNLTWWGQSYLGIPYGKAERFSPSVSFGSWDGIRSAEQYGPQCYQPSVFCNLAPQSCNQEMSEDCLTLNIYTPRRARYDPRKGNHKYAVLVWIHGGYYQAYTAGSPYYNGLKLASAARIIVVTLNYRLGPLGFLNIPDVQSTGNYGFYDQRLALQWVRNNIHYFGGDPNRVTLGGESAGAHSTMFHMMTPGSQSLFQRAILMSTPGIEVPTSDVAGRTATGLLNGLGCDTSDNKLECLRGKTAEEIVTQSLLLPATQNFLQGFQRFGVYIDGQEIMESFYDNTNIKNKFGGKPVIIGTSAYESLSLTYTRLTTPVPAPLFGAVVGQWRTAIVPETQNLYLSSPSSDTDIRPEIAELLTDVIFTCPARLFADSISAENKVWVYVFDQPNLDSYIQPLSCEDRACHVEDFPYLFRHPDLVPGAEDKFFFRLSNLIVGYFGNFVKNGNPNSRWRTPKWTEYHSDSTSKGQNLTLELQYPNPQKISNFRKDRCDYWDRVGYEKESP
ncbi:para-nitrobenzyl esterase-like [Saccostrea echinata]|uniref:para-nitrobenzyl esterase-like n=1 Tax=Saccostrea echinata TaxID=191078 RepID=UPI002A832D49|nr:para-nitrobenzyl esterase-like [Saccostrea echinata]